MKVEALREDARQRALAHVGIRKSVTAPDSKPWGDRITTLAKEWANTWRDELTPPQQRVRVHCRCIVVFGTNMTITYWL